MHAPEHPIHGAPKQLDPVSRRAVLKGLAVVGAGVAIAELTGCSSSSTTSTPATTTTGRGTTVPTSPPSTIPKVLRKPGSRPNPTLPEGTDTLPKIEHIIIVMMENHSFDGRFGMLGRGDGFKLDANGKPLDANPMPDGRLLRAFHMPSTCQLKGLPGQDWVRSHTSWADGRNDGFVKASGPVSMGYWDEADIPFYYGLAKQFPVCDRYFCSTLAQTYPNRRFAIAGTASGVVSTDFSNITKFAPANGTIFDRLHAHGITWRNYASDLPGVAVIAGVANTYGKNISPIAQFHSDAAAGKLPSVSIVDPRFEVDPSESEENPSDLSYGENFVAKVVNSALHSPNWKNTVLIYTYDEHGGYYDHVAPPPAVKPDNIRPGVDVDKQLVGAYDRYGFRVPTVIVSPFAKRDYVSHQVHDHTSMLKLIETKWNLGALTYRDANASNLLDSLDLVGRLHSRNRRPCRRRTNPRSARRVARAARSRRPTRSCPRAGPRRSVSAPGPSVVAVAVDVRSRIDGPRAEVDPARFFDDELPARLDEHAHAIVPALAFIRPRPTVVEVETEAWTLEACDRRVAIERGARDDATAHVRLSREQLADLADDQQTFMSMWAAGALEQRAGTVGHLLDWWLVLRAALDGTPIYTRGSVSFDDRDGGQLDLMRAFHPDDDRAEMRHFLETAGFLHIEGLFDVAEMDAISADMDRSAPSYDEGDGRSWWARTSDGSTRLVRMQGFDRESDGARALVEDARFLDLASIAGTGHRFGTKRAHNRIEALFKPIGVTEGISDIPWHKDCGIGRHSYDCCGLTVGVSVTGADAGSGQLWVLAGSHRALVWSGIRQPDLGLPEVPLATRTGDVTLHLSCTMHMAQPPVERERRVMYSGFALPPLASADPDAVATGRARLGAVREGAPLTVLDRHFRS